MNAVKATTQPTPCTRKRPGIAVVGLKQAGPFPDALGDLLTILSNGGTGVVVDHRSAASPGSKNRLNGPHSPSAPSASATHTSSLTFSVGVGINQSAAFTPVITKAPINR